MTKMNSSNRECWTYALGVLIQIMISTWIYTSALGLLIIFMWPDWAAFITLGMLVGIVGAIHMLGFILFPPRRS